MKKLLLAMMLAYAPAFAQVENVPVANPVYNYLTRAEAKGILPHFSSSMLPLSRAEITSALKSIRRNASQLSANDLRTLERFEKDFGLVKEENLVVFYSEKDTSQVLSSRFFDDNPKYVYHHADSANNVTLSPLASADFIAKSSDEDDGNVLYGNIGFRLYGSLGSHFGYYLQATNGAIFSGDKSIALVDKHIGQNVKFTELKSDFDFTESSVTVEYDWFHATIGRETRLWGSGVNNSLYISANAPAFTTIELGAKFKNFEYRFSHGGLIATYSDSIKVGFNAVVAQKYVAMHRLAVKPSWGEFGFWESIVYSKRNMDLEYLNPLSFYKSLEHALRDRDNSMIGVDMTVRPLKNIELRGSFILDDIIFGEVGNDYWSNKYAWNLGAWFSPDCPLDFGVEYARIEPYMFSHFDSLNNYANDNRLIGIGLMPNSEEYSATARYWLGLGKYPVEMRLAYRRHGANEYDADGNMTRNVGGDFAKTRMPEDSERVKFLDGDLQETFSVSVGWGFELFRDFTMKFSYTLNHSVQTNDEHYLRLTFMYLDF